MRSAPPSTNVGVGVGEDRKSTRLNSSHLGISYAVFCLKKKKNDGQNKNKTQHTGDTKLSHVVYIGHGALQLIASCQILHGHLFDVISNPNDHTRKLVRV